jgi:predicted regulator of Ras-like GTPase activity (Roadblock/LC7/MglB family)
MANQANTSGAEHIEKLLQTLRKEIKKVSEAVAAPSPTVNNKATFSAAIDEGILARMKAYAFDHGMNYYEVYEKAFEMFLAGQTKGN